jgi:hypothetical protein
MNIADGDHNSVLLGERRGVMELWASSVTESDDCAMIFFVDGAGHSLEDVVPVISYAHVAKAAFSLSSLAEIIGSEFDPVEFGKRCEAIAREQGNRARRAVFEIEDDE